MSIFASSEKMGTAHGKSEKSVSRSHSLVISRNTMLNVMQDYGATKETTRKVDIFYMCNFRLIEWKSYPQKAKDQNLISSVQHLGAALALRPSALGIYLVIYSISSESIGPIARGCLILVSG